ncbi:unnamed protein product [Schistocephalus solidus]|uniref:Uncharacterized protein n=1 Tax=Schistocephalus solidus TaxID=70667 RepID=A0A183SFF8_SCHSO|nr:unnamed protein product [Schistocephalus solidus]
MLIALMHYRHDAAAVGGGGGGGGGRDRLRCRDDDDYGEGKDQGFLALSLCAAISYLSHLCYPLSVTLPVG